MTDLGQDWGGVIWERHNSLYKFVWRCRQVKEGNGKQLAILDGDGAGPEVCLAESKS